MTMISSHSGIKVGWETYDNEAEALERSETARKQAEEMLEQGYDFGYCCPGEVVKHSTEGFWIVTIP